MILYDQRWYGDHGIGRFAREVGARLILQDAGLRGSPSAPLDPLNMTLSLRGLARSDMFFSPGYNAPLLSPVRFFFTIHDLNHLDVAANGSIAKRMYYELFIRSGIAR